MGGSSANRSRSALDVVLPRFDEPVSREFYQFAGKLRLVVLVLMLSSNALAGTSLETLGLDPEFYWRLQLPNTAILLTDIGLNWYLWRRARSLATMRRLVIAGAIIETISCLLSMWQFGTLNSHMLVAAVVLLMIYRLAFDFRTGATVFLVLLTGMWGLTVAEVAGWIPSQPARASGLDFLYRDAGRMIGTALFLSLMLALAFVMANWAVVRLRHKNRAIRILREALAASEAGKIGRHTGRTLNETYTVETLIAAGGMGEVYRGRHLRTNRPVALKILHPHLLDDEVLLERFRREAQIAGQLGSRHIVEVLDVTVDDGQPYIVLELLEGEDLATRIARAGALPPAECAEVVDQLARGLAVAHAAGVVHRDLKPENVFLCREHDAVTVKILDFGVSKIRGQATALTQEVALLGTPDFMAPEQALGTIEDVGPAADVFAVGAIAYCALTGVPPFQSTSVPAVLRRICDEEPVPVTERRTGVPAAVDDVLAIALAKSPEQRYGDVTKLSGDLRAALSGEDRVEVRRRASAVERGTRPARSVPGHRTVDPAAQTQAQDAGALDAMARTETLPDRDSG